MELIFASGLVLLVTAGLALGLILGGRALQTACTGISCPSDGGGCEVCSRRASEDVLQ